nr:hypothetical protein LTR18_009926 [Exophiala xenobiotica]
MPTKPKRAKSPDSQFLFVNEDASTVTRTTKDAELDRTKQSHVQRQNFARKRRLRGQSISGQQSSSQSSVSPSPAIVEPSNEVPSSAQGAPSYGNDYFNIFQNLDLGEAQYYSTSPASLPQDPLDPRLFAMFSNPFASTASSPSVLTMPVGGFDASPFYRPDQSFDMSPPNYTATLPQRGSMNMSSPSRSSSRITSPIANNQRILEQWAPLLIQHYNTVILPEKFWKDVQKVPLGQIRHAPSIHSDMKACMSEPAHMYAFLASAAIQMLVREGKLLLPNVSEEDYQRVPTFFKTKAIQAVRTKLASGQIDHQVAVDVHKLYCTGIHADNPEVAEPHFQALLSMIESLGGLSTFDDYQQEKMIMIDCLAALKTLGVPRLLSTWAPGSLPDEILSSLESQSRYDFGLGVRLEAMFQALNATRLMTDAFSDLIQLLKMSAYLHDADQYIPEHHKWFSWRCLTLLHGLLSMPLRTEMDDRMECLRIAAAFWVALARSPQLGRRAASKSAHLLRQKLESTGIESLWGPHADCLLWVVVLGGICADNGDDLQWYVDVSRGAAGELGLNTPAGLQELFSQLLYDPPSQRDMLLRFAERMWPIVES